MKTDHLYRLLLKKELVTEESKAKALIMAGKVLVNGQLCDKPGTKIRVDASIVVKEKEFPYVSRGALKLEKAIEFFEVKVSDLICLDIGASTGGFTDCLLKKGAGKVYAVDVGYGQLDWKLRQDDRVVTYERTNIRHLDAEKIREPIDLTVIDTSFISLKTVVPASLKFMKNDGEILALIKPQFEVKKDEVGKGGIVIDPLLHESVKDNLSLFFEETGLKVLGICDSPILGTKGNKEFIIHLRLSL